MDCILLAGHTTPHLGEIKLVALKRTASLNPGFGLTQAKHSAHQLNVEGFAKHIVVPGFPEGT